MTDNSVIELMELEREACRRQQARDFGWIIDRHTEDAVMLPPGAAALPSLDVLRSAKARVETGEPSNSKSTFSWEPTTAVIAPDDQMGFVYGVTEENREDGSVIVGKFLSVWVRDGENWKVAVEIRNEN